MKKFISHFIGVATLALHVILIVCGICAVFGGIILAASFLNTAREGHDIYYLLFLAASIGDLILMVFVSYFMEETCKFFSKLLELTEKYFGEDD